MEWERGWGREGTYEIGIPHPHDILDAHFSHEKTVHPAKGELNEFDVVFL